MDADGQQEKCRTGVKRLSDQPSIRGFCAAAESATDSHAMAIGELASLHEPVSHHLDLFRR